MVWFGRAQTCEIELMCGPLLATAGDKKPATTRMTTSLDAIRFIAGPFRASKFDGGCATLYRCAGIVILTTKHHSTRARCSFFSPRSILLRPGGGVKMND